MKQIQPLNRSNCPSKFWFVWPPTQAAGSHLSPLILPAQIASNCCRSQSDTQNFADEGVILPSLPKKKKDEMSLWLPLIFAAF